MADLPLLNLANACLPCPVCGEALTDDWQHLVCCACGWRCRVGDEVIEGDAD